MISAPNGDLLTGLLAAGGALLIVLLIWILIHHTKPELKIDIGVRGWINLTKPPTDDHPPQDDEHDDPDAGEVM